MRDVLRLLQDGEYHSGEVIGSVLGLSRAAVWKRLQSLESELGLVIHRIRGRGYRLQAPISLLDCSRLENDCRDAGWAFSCFESIDSTNAEVLRRLAANDPAPLLVVAEKQDGGRGRRGRSWISPYAANLYYSLGLRLEGGSFPLEGLSLSVGLAVLRTLEEVGCAGSGLKWPNDLLVGGRKIAGILLELAGDPSDDCQVVIGIGVNVNMLPSAAVEIDQPWTSLREQAGLLLDRTAVALSLGHWLRYYLALHAKAGFASVQAEWQEAHLWQGKAVSLQAGVQRIDGVVLGVDRTGALRLEIDGEERQFSGGEISLRLRDDS